MKIKNVYKLIGVMVLFVTLQSRSTGPGGTANLQVTGAPGSTGNMGTCANTGCHTAGAFDPSLEIQLLDGSNPAITYEPGKSYTLKVSVASGTGSPSGFGFQAVSLDGSDNQAGAWGDLGAQKQKVSIGNRSYAEHSTPSSSSNFEMEWIAPTTGTGAVTFYSAGLAANKNSSNSGDGEAHNTLTVEEGGVSSVFDQQGQFASLKILPNPVTDVLNLQVISRRAGDFNIRIIDISGKIVKQVPVTLQIGTNLSQIEVAVIPPGLYAVQLCGEGHLSATQMLKY